MNNLAYLGPETGPFSLKESILLSLTANYLPRSDVLLDPVKFLILVRFWKLSSTSTGPPKDLGTISVYPNFIWRSIDVSGRPFCQSNLTQKSQASCKLPSHL